MTDTNKVAQVIREVAENLRKSFSDELKRQREEVLREVEKQLGDCIRYRGAYNPEKSYDPCSLVQKDGTLYISRSGAEPSELPGKSDAWRMLVKTRDGSTS
jgi:hypothetical protein